MLAFIASVLMLIAIVFGVVSLFSITDDRRLFWKLSAVLSLSVGVIILLTMWSVNS